MPPAPIFAALTQTQLLLCVLAVVIGLVWLITQCRVPAFIALILASLAVGACGGLNVGRTCTAFQEGVGALLGAIAIIIALGTVLGKLLQESGGAEQIAQRLLAVFGQRYLPWTMLLLGFVIGIPVFFAVGLVLLAPILFAVREKSGLPFLKLAIPLLAGLSAAHGLVPPHPGPLAAIGVLNADVGKTIFYSLIIGAAAAVISGPILVRVLKLSAGIEPQSTVKPQASETRSDSTMPPFWPTLLTILLPVLLMLLATAADLTFAPGHAVRRIADALGTPLAAMLIAVLVAFWVLGFARGYDSKKLLKFSEECLGPIASVLVVVGAGGGFNKVLIVSGVGTAIADFARQIPVSPLVFGWLVAAVIRVATGSATVAITTAAGIVAPIVAATPGIQVELLVIAMGGGSLILSHVNDGGFWLVKEYLGLSVTETLKSWTVMETALSISTLVLTLLLSQLVR